MVLTISNLPLAFVLAIAFAFGIFLVAFLFILLRKTFRKKVKDEEAKKLEPKTVSIITRGKHLNRYLLYAMYIVVFGIIAVFLMLSFFTINDIVVFSDMWPFIFVVVVLIFCSLVIVERVKTESKRTVQRDMRRL
ncbi:MAG: DUF1049 domain-containing protein [Candidatus Heimdallarchaeota archaeon]|nr:MAG: DUF1049 domain-containing protein [Candidatus Heimdallarchaeota archaeon]